MKTMKFRQTLFWDVDPKNIDPEKNAQYIIERVADLGNDKEARWALDYYSKEQLRKVINNPRVMRPRTKALWTLLLKNK